MGSMNSLIDVAVGNKKASLVLKNGYIVNVFNGCVEKNDIAIDEDKIAGIGKYDGIEEIDCTGLFLSPGFIDSHVHIESSMVTPEIFSDIILKRGVTTAIADPHEIANVMGTDGIDFMIENSKTGSADIFFMIPSCVPSSSNEDNGAQITAEDMKKYTQSDKVLGLGELMNVSALINKDEEVLKKLDIFKNKIKDGHCPGISEKLLNAYIGCGISTDHECKNYEEALKKIQRGMYVLIREGSAAKNLKAILPAVNSDNFHRFLFCTDDRHVSDIIKEGTIDYMVRTSIKEGLDPVKAITIATLNAAQCYNLKNRGAIAPGNIADIIIFEDLNKINIKHIIKAGKEYTGKTQYESVDIKSSINMNFVTKDDFKIESNSKDKYVNVIKVIPRMIETRKDKRKFVTKDGAIYNVEGEDILKIAVLERHKNTGKKAVGFIQGLGISDCSLAQTICHDSHNIIVAGSDDADMAVAVNGVINIGGGIVIASHGKILEYLKLPIGGLMADKPADQINDYLKQIYEIIKSHSTIKNIDPIITLSFMALPVIPELKITTRGYFDYKTLSFINTFQI